MGKNIVVTGMGAVTPIGCGVESYWNNLISGSCGVDAITQFDTTGLAVRIAAEVKDFHAGNYMPKKLIRETDPFTQYAYAAAEEALGGCLPAAPERTGIVMGTAMAGIATTAAQQEILTNAVHKNVGPRFVPRILGNIAAAQIAIANGISGPSLTISTACASGGDAVTAGAMLLLAGEADAVLAVGAESILCPLVIYSLANAHTLSRENADPTHACRPFDARHSGFVIGEGGGALVLETEEHAAARGARVYARLAGWANNNDAYHVVNPTPDGHTAAICMQKALAKSGLSAQDVDYINAHGTGTKTGDRAEIAALRQVFGGDGMTAAAAAAAPVASLAGTGAGSKPTAPDPAAGPAISSTKGATGHMMGSGGITEAIACIQAIRTGKLPPTLNLERPEAEMDFVALRSRQQKITVAMTNAFGFGGQNSSLVFCAL